jgi:hypothetical protein
VGCPYPRLCYGSEASSEPPFGPLATPREAQEDGASPRFSPEEGASKRFSPEDGASPRFSPEEGASKRFSPEEGASKRFSPEEPRPESLEPRTDILHEASLRTEDEETHGSDASSRPCSPQEPNSDPEADGGSERGLESNPTGRAPSQSLSFEARWGAPKTPSLRFSSQVRDALDQLSANLADEAELSDGALAGGSQDGAVRTETSELRQASSVGAAAARARWQGALKSVAAKEAESERSQTAGVAARARWQGALKSVVPSASHPAQRPELRRETSRPELRRATSRSVISEVGAGEFKRIRI